MKWMFSATYISNQSLLDLMAVVIATLTLAVVGLIVMAIDHVTLSWTQIFWLVSCGLFGGVGQVLMTYCYRYGEPSLLAPFDYTAMVWAMLLGWFVLGEHPEAMVLTGAAVVIASGLLIAWREYRHKVEMPMEPLT